MTTATGIQSRTWRAATTRAVAAGALASWVPVNRRARLSPSARRESWVTLIDESEQGRVARLEAGRLRVPQHLESAVTRLSLVSGPESQILGRQSSIAGPRPTVAWRLGTKDQRP